MKNASGISEPGIGRRTRVLPLIVLGLCVAVVVALVHRLYDNEPRYRGQRLMDWVEQLDAPGAEQRQAQTAIHAIGTNAIPFLLRSVRQNAWQQNKVAVWSKLPARMQEIVPAPDSDYDLRLNKVPIALSLFGGAALPSLITAAQDHNVDVQFVAVRAIGMMGPGGESALPTLIPLLAQTNEFIRTTVASAIGQIGPIRTQAIPALVAALPETAGTLGAIGPEAQAAVPALTALLDNPTEYVRLNAATALWQITHNTNLLYRVIAELEKRQGYANYKGFLHLLGEMGPAAKPAVPAILKSMNNWGTDVSRPVRPVLLRIDPDAVAALNKSER
jgi:hypothetical protein